MVETRLKGRDFLDLADFSPIEIGALLDSAADFKASLVAGETTFVLPGRVLGLLFMKKSTRTRLSFEVGIYQLGGMGLFLLPEDLQLGHGETLRDTAKVVSRYLSAIMIRSVHHSDVIDFAESATIPVINGMTASAHPCQALADLLTIREVFGGFVGVRAVYLGAAQNVGTSLMMGASMVGMDFVMCCPEGYGPTLEAWEGARTFAALAGGKLVICRDPREAVSDAHIIYTDSWTPPELEAEHEKRCLDLRPYQANAGLLKLAAPEVHVMHCLPAHYGEEITEEVVYGPSSLVFQQVENRLHVQKAVLAAIVP